MFILIALIVIIAMLVASSTHAAKIRRLQKATGTAPEGVGPFGYLFAGLVFIGILIAAFW